VVVQQRNDSSQWRRAKVVAIVKQRVAGEMQETYSVVYSGPPGPRGAVSKPSDGSGSGVSPDDVEPAGVGDREDGVTRKRLLRA